MPYKRVWFDDDVTPGKFRAELNKCRGDISVWINSPGGGVRAAAQIYNMLMEYPGNVRVRIDGLAASAATIVAMAGNTVEISPVGCMFVHNPEAMSIGNVSDHKLTIEMLKEVKESIINAYEIKTGALRRRKAGAFRRMSLGGKESVLPMEKSVLLTADFSDWTKIKKREKL